MFRRNLTRLTDADLVLRAQRGDPAAFEELYRRYSGRVYALLFGMVGNTDDAAELAQEVFLRAFRRIGSLRADQAVYGWLRATATNLGIDFLRHGKLIAYEPLEGTNPNAPRDIVSPQDDPERAVIRQETQEAVVDAVANLKPAHRMVVALHHFEGMSVEEVATALDVPVGTVKSRLARARDALRTALAPIVEGKSGMH
jgi:RNA polymerase sigma-70 factor (ECF subfamily)